MCFVRSCLRFGERGEHFVFLPDIESTTYRLPFLDKYGWSRNRYIRLPDPIRFPRNKTSADEGKYMAWYTKEIWIIYSIEYILRLWYIRKRTWNRSSNTDKCDCLHLCNRFPELRSTLPVPVRTGRFVGQNSPDGRTTTEERRSELSKN